VTRLGGPGAWILFGITALIMAFILTPLLIVVAMSTSDTYFASFPPEGFTLAWYGKALTDREFLSSLAFSALLALGATATALLMGVPAAFALVRGSFPGRSFIKGLLLSPLIFPALVTGLALLQLFSNMGWRDARVNLLIAHALVTSPYVIRTVMTSLMLVDVRLEEAARTLGASRLRTFRRIILPQIAPGVAAGSIFAFMVSFDNYPVSMWLADAEHNPVPLVIYRQIVTVFDPSVAAMSTIMIVLALAVVLVLERLVGLRRAMTL